VLQRPETLNYECVLHSCPIKLFFWTVFYTELGKPWDFSNYMHNLVSPQMILQNIARIKSSRSKFPARQGALFILPTISV
jgi:hypothetical protein